MMNEHESEPVVSGRTADEGSAFAAAVARSGAKPYFRSFEFKLLLGVLFAVALVLTFWPNLSATMTLENNRACYQKESDGLVAPIVSRLTEKVKLPHGPLICIMNAGHPEFATGTHSISTDPAYGQGESAIFITENDLESPHLAAILAHEISHIVAGDSYKPLRANGVRKMHCRYGKTIELEADRLGASLVGFGPMIALFDDDKNAYKASCGDDPHPGSDERATALRNAQQKK